jgi:hypothetical protein
MATLPVCLIIATQQYFHDRSKENLNRLYASLDKLDKLLEKASEATKQERNEIYASLYDVFHGHLPEGGPKQAIHQTLSLVTRLAPEFMDMGTAPLNPFDHFPRAGFTPDLAHGAHTYSHLKSDDCKAPPPTTF